jgi:hypothetical protein
MASKLKTEGESVVWWKQWRTIAAFVGISSLGGLISVSQKVVGYLAAPAIQAADSSAQRAWRETAKALADTIAARQMVVSEEAARRQSRGFDSVFNRLDRIEDVVSRMPGASRAGEESRRAREIRQRTFGVR